MSRGPGPDGGFQNRATLKRNPRTHNSPKIENPCPSLFPTSKAKANLKLPIYASMANVEAEAVDFEPEDDDLMDEEVADGSPNRTAAIPRLKSAIAGGDSASAPKKTKGRGFRDEASEAERNARMSARFDSLDSEGGPGPERC